MRTINTSDETSPSRQLYSLLFGPLHESFHKQKITTLLISANTGLQAVPFSALHDGEEWFGTRFSISLTPSLSLIKHLQGDAGASRKSFLAGSSIFDGLVASLADPPGAVGARKFDNGCQRMPAD